MFHNHNDIFESQFSDYIFKYSGDKFCNARLTMHTEIDIFYMGYNWMIWISKWKCINQEGEQITATFATETISTHANTLWAQAKRKLNLNCVPYPINITDKEPFHSLLKFSLIRNHRVKNLWRANTLWKCGPRLAD